MDKIIRGIITKPEDWIVRIRQCEEITDNCSHLTIFSKSVMPGSAIMIPDSPFLCTSVCRESIDLSGNEKDEWVHICMTLNDAISIQRTYVAQLCPPTGEEPDRTEQVRQLEQDLEIEEDIGIIDEESIREELNG